MLKPGRGVSRGKGFDPYEVLPLRGGQDFKQKKTSASHLKQRRANTVNLQFSKRQSLRPRLGLKNVAAEKSTTEFL